MVQRTNHGHGRVKDCMVDEEYTGVSSTKLKSDTSNVGVGSSEKENGLKLSKSTEM